MSEVIKPINLEHLLRDLREAIGQVLLKHGVDDIAAHGISIDYHPQFRELKIQEIAITGKEEKQDE